MLLCCFFLRFHKIQNKQTKAATCTNEFPFDLVFQSQYYHSVVLANSFSEHLFHFAFSFVGWLAPLHPTSWFSFAKSTSKNHRCEGTGASEEGATQRSSGSTLCLFIDNTSVSVDRPSSGILHRKSTAAFLNLLVGPPLNLGIHLPFIFTLLQTILVRPLWPFRSQ